MTVITAAAVNTAFNTIYNLVDPDQDTTVGVDGLDYSFEVDVAGTSGKSIIFTAPDDLEVIEAVISFYPATAGAQTGLLQLADQSNTVELINLLLDSAATGEATTRTDYSQTTGERIILRKGTRYGLLLLFSTAVVINHGVAQIFCRTKRRPA